MGDIDFDELDKAVNSLMGSADTPGASQETTTASPQEQTKSISQFARPSRPVVTSSSEVLQKPKTPAVRRSGRFMDVVDSSSDLNPLRKPLAMPSRDVAHRNPAAASPLVADVPELPVSNVVVNDNTAQLNEISNESVPVEVPEAPEVTGTNADTSSGHAIKVNLGNKNTESFPDPIDLMQASSVEQDDSQDVQPAAVFGEPSPVAAPSVSVVDAGTRNDDTTSFFSVKVKSATTEQVADDLSAPQEAVMPGVAEESAETLQPTAGILSDSESVEPVLENDSPFIVNAKVEKRPLNAEPLAATEPDTLLQSIDDLMQSAQLPIQEEDTNSFGDTAAPEVPSYEQKNVSEVPELSNELVKIEATGKASVPQESAPAQEPTPVVVPIPEPNAPVGPSSIPQQYQTQESSGDASHAPIYDANELAVPVAHPAKKKSGWLLVLAVLILLALGSGGAVVLYLTGIIP